MIFDLLATIFCGGVVLKEDLHRSIITKNNKSKAIENGEAVYFDDIKSTFRSVKTNEIVHHIKQDGIDKDVGVKTHHIYKCVDHNREWEEKMIKYHNDQNEEMRKLHKNVYWKRYSNLDYKDAKGKLRLGYYTVDKVTDKPIWTVIKRSDGKVELMYASTDKRGMKTFNINGRTKFDSRVISSDEYYEKYSPYVYTHK